MDSVDIVRLFRGSCRRTMADDWGALVLPISRSPMKACSTGRSRIVSGGALKTPPDSNHEVGQYVLGNSTLLVLLEGEVGRFPAMEANPLLEADCLLRPGTSPSKPRRDRHPDRDQRSVGAEWEPGSNRTPAGSRSVRMAGRKRATCCRGSLRWPAVPARHDVGRGSPPSAQCAAWQGHREAARAPHAPSRGGGPTHRNPCPW